MDRVLAATLVLASMLPSAARAQQLPPGVFAGARDYKAAAAGTYEIDPAHTAVIAKISHIGYALSVFRFDAVEGILTWDPADPSRSTLTATVRTASIATPVPGFSTELAGPAYLDAAAFPTATFVSSAFHQSDDRHGTVDGTFNFLGKAHPLTFAVTLEGAGKGFMGHARLGVAATGAIDPQAYGMNALFSTPVRIEIDAEFQRKETATGGGG